MAFLVVRTNEKFEYPTDVFHSCWEDLLLNQFHDVLPGSSIGMVYVEAHKVSWMLRTWADFAHVLISAIVL